MVVLKTWAMWSLIVLFVGYSGSDLRALCEEAAMMPIRELGPQNILTIKANQVCF
jgi:spastin